MKLLKTRYTGTAILFVVVGAVCSPTINASGDFESGVVASFTSVNGVSEQCIELAPMPHAHYSKHDRKTSLTIVQ